MLAALLIVLVSLAVALAKCPCYVPFPEPVPTVVKSRVPHSFLKAQDLPARWDWRDVNGTNYCTRTLTQQNPSVCGSCWAEAATGALSDRYNIATNNKLHVQLGVQNLLNFKDRISGGSCMGGDSLKAYHFAYTYGMSDDTCAPFLGVDYPRGFTVADMVKAEDVQAHQCYICDWDGNCSFLPREQYDLYGVDEYGSVTGVEEMKAEIFARGPIACSLNSEANSFDLYKGGIIRCDDPNDKPCKWKGTDHVIVVAGWGVDAATGDEYWIGRNSYGSRWGEGSGGGWFRLLMHKDVLNMESHACSWAVPAKADVQRALDQFERSK